MIDFKGQTVIVTGAGRGLGRLYALEFGRLGANVVVNDLGGSTEGSGSDAKVADEVVAEIKQAGGNAVASYDSVATKEANENIVRIALDSFGRLDAVVCNAGILRNAPFEEITVDQWKDLQTVHLDGTFYLAQAAFKVMRGQGYGRLVLTSSSSGVLGNAEQANYGAAKNGIVGLSNVIAIEGEPHGILSNTLLPGGMTRMLVAASGGNPAILDGPMGKMMAPEKVVPMVIYLASKECQVSHQNFSATMGRYARVFTGVGSGYFPDPGTIATADDIAANFEAVSSTDDFYVPFSVVDETTEVFGRYGIQFEIPPQQ